MKKKIYMLLVLLSLVCFMPNVKAVCTCPDSDYTLNGTKCVKTKRAGISQGDHYCNEGRLSGDQCIIEKDANCTTEAPTVNENPIQPNNPSTSNPTPSTHKAGADASVCPIGEADVKKDLLGVLNVMKIAGPLLVLVFTIYELIRDITFGKSDDTQGNLKKIGNRLIKRLIYCVILFSIPILVSAIMRLTGVISENGGCDFTQVQNHQN